MVVYGFKNWCFLLYNYIFKVDAVPFAKRFFLELSCFAVG